MLWAWQIYAYSVKGYYLVKQWILKFDQFVTHLKKAQLELN